jgi:hypothetical protein
MDGMLIVGLAGHTPATFDVVDTSKYFARITDFPRNGISLSPSNAGPILSQSPALLH